MLGLSVSNLVLYQINWSMAVIMVEVVKSHASGPRLYFTKYTCTCVHAYVYIYIYFIIYLFTYAWMYTSACYIYIYAYMYTHALMYIPTWENHGHIHLQWDISWGTIYVVKIIASSTIPLYIPWPRPKGINRELSCSFNGIINHWQTIMTKMTLLGGNCITTNRWEDHWKIHYIMGYIYIVGKWTISIFLAKMEVS